MFKIQAIFICVFTNIFSLSAPLQDKRPNIILIIADDLGSSDLGTYGHPFIKTPNIDKLAEEGMRFTNAYLTTSSCSPSRASIITGSYPHQTDAEQLHWPVPANKITFVEKLKEAGYWTAQAGKWHLGDALINRFDFLAMENTEGFVYGEENKGAGDEVIVSDDSGCQNWVSTLKKHPKDKPFFLWLASVDPHRPYKEQAISVPHLPSDVMLPPYLPDAKEVRQDCVNYYDEISRMDSYVGKVMQELKSEGIEDNTLILFISDNGRPFPREKTTLYDGGIKTPWIIKWPAFVKKGTVTGALVSSVDIATTVLSVAKVKPGPEFIGKDISPLLSDPQKEIRQYIYAEDHWHDFEDYGRAVRDKRYKYIRNFYPDLPETPSADILRDLTFQYMLKQKGNGTLDTALMSYFYLPKMPEELYDTEKDPYELNNLVKDAAYYSILNTMRRQLDKMRKDTGDSLPSRRTPDEFSRETGQPLPNRKRPRPSKEDMNAKGYESLKE
ncbi:MAG: sulfatase [Daejeonella sp.]